MLVVLLSFKLIFPLVFLGECVLAVVYFINRTPLGLLNGLTPYEVSTGRAPSFDEMRLFGCLYFAYNQRSRGNKVASRSQRCAFVGYPNGKDGACMTLRRGSVLFLVMFVSMKSSSFCFG